MPFDTQGDETLANVELLARTLEETTSFDIHDHGSCGTPMCIAGHAVFLWPDVAQPNTGPHYIPDDRKFAQKLGVDETKLYEMCYCWDGCWDDTQPSNGCTGKYITGKMAATAIRRLKETGEGYFSMYDD